MNYDPNLTTFGRMAQQTVKLIFGCWDFRKEVTTTVGGNCTGFTVIESAVGRVYEELPGFDYDGDFYAQITLTNAAGEELECDDEDLKGEDWLRNMLISAEITDIVPEPEGTGDDA